MKFELDIQEADLILRALMAQPMQAVEALVNKMRQQAAPQLQGETPQVEEPKAVQ